MNVLLIFAITVIAFKLAYRFYGRYIDVVFDMNKENATPPGRTRTGRITCGASGR